jgi:hypothetical protein
LNVEPQDHDGRVLVSPLVHVGTEHELAATVQDVGATKILEPDGIVDHRLSL